MRKCRCDNVPLSLEVKTPGINRGRWYQRCPTGTCRFFAWDESPHAFITHPVEVYSSIKPRTNTRPAYFNTQMELRESQSAIPKTKIPVAFSILSKQLIGIKTNANLTLEPVFAGIENIKWSDEHGQWTIPATVPMYNLAISALPTEIPNLQLEIETIPPAILDSIIEMSLLESNARMHDPDEMTEIEFQWSEFVGSNIFRLLTPVQQKGVSFGLERCGRVLFGNENGVGSIGQVLALTQVYKDEWPVLVTCPNILRHTWKHEIKKWLGISDDEICIMDPKEPARDAFKESPVKRKKPARRPKFRAYKKRVERRLNEDDYESSSESDEDEDVKVKQEDDVEHVSNIKFYITSHQHATKRRREIKIKNFQTIVCSDSHHWKTMTTIAPIVFTDFDLYTKRYCDAKATVFGCNYEGESNKAELGYLLDSNVWYAPKSEQLKPGFPEFDRQEHEKTGEIKKEEIIQYFDYVFETYKRPKIAVFYHNEGVFKALEAHLKVKKKKLVHLDNIYDSNSICEEYNQSHSVQFLFLDMKMSEIDVSLHSVDLVAFRKGKAQYNGISFSERRGPLSIKYLIALQTIGMV
ncbi:hypothetical protein MFLAVUS_004532 [Mucor flavus]|uniref:GRF-type domain-containing protein n=1 Tax=Mucor flavus TaxID=439312 RepID=A0ABP9YW62_9FUNG